MSKDRDEYLDRDRSYSPGRRRRRNNRRFVLFGVILAVMAVGCGVLGYTLAIKYLEKNEPKNNPGQGQVTQVANASQTPAVNNTSTPTPTPSATPTPFIRPGFDDPYLIGFDDFREPFPVRGAYVGHMSKGSSIYDNITWLAGFTELNAVVIDVKDDFGYITYDMDCKAVQDMGLVTPKDGKYYIEDMKGLLEDLHSRGIYCIARVVCFKESYYTDSPIVRLHPEWLLKNKDGSLFRDKTVLNGTSKPYAWMNFYNRDALEFIVDVAEQAALDGFDEICLDYMRTPTDVKLSDLDYGTEAESVSYSEQIVKFIRYACNRLKPLGVFVSGSVYGITIDSAIDSANLGQDYKELAGYLDYICPMIYPSHYGTNFGVIENVKEHPYELVAMEVRNSEKKLKAVSESEVRKTASCRPWLQAFGYEYGQIRVQVEACYENGADTWLYWNSGGYYEQEVFLTKEEAAAQAEQQKNE